MPELKLNEFSAREIQVFAEDLEKANKTKEQDLVFDPMADHYMKGSISDFSKPPIKFIVAPEDEQNQ